MRPSTLALLALVACPLTGAAALKLVVDGRSDYQIVLAQDASPSERHGARELQMFLEQISGAKLPIVNAAPGRSIVIGGRAGFSPEEFLLKTDGENLIIAGGKQRGTMYGVYTLLDKLGCRWFTRDVSRIPKRRTIEIGPLDERRRPAFEYREPFFPEARDRDWAARNRVNGQSQELDTDRGGKVQYFPFVHSFDKLIPPARYFEKHPEYFSLIDGKRRAERSQLCLTNPDVLRLGVERVLQWIQQHPEATIISVSQNDWTGWCECDNCRRVEQEEGGVHSGPVLRYVNALAGEIEKTHPDKLIDTLAYWYTEEPPSRTKPRANVRVRLCPIGACEGHPYEKCPYNAYFMNNLRAWSKITDQLYIWHYNTNFAHHLLPFPDFDELAADIPMYLRHGVRGIFLEGAPRVTSAEGAELRSYIMARLLWDTKTDVWRDIDDFHESFYGAAAKPMREYFDLQHEQVRKGNHLWIFGQPGSPYLSAAFLEKARMLLDRAASVANNDVVRERVKKARLSVDYTQLMHDKKMEIRDGVLTLPDLEGLKQRWQLMISTIRGFGIPGLREHTTLEADDETFQRMMRPYKVATIENERLRLVFAEELGGRVIRLTDKKTSRQVLSEPDPGSASYPAGAGLTIAVGPDFVQAPWSIKWRIREARPAELLLEGTAKNGFSYRRVLRLNGASLHTETTLENSGTSPVEAAISSRVDVDPGDMGRSELQWGKMRRPVIPLDKASTGNENLEGPSQPDGEWSMVTRGRVILRNRFPRAESQRVSVNWSLRDNRVGLTVWSRQQTVAPGGRLTFECDYLLE